VTRHVLNASPREMAALLAWAGVTVESGGVGGSQTVSGIAVARLYLSTVTTGDHTQRSVDTCGELPPALQWVSSVVAAK